MLLLLDPRPAALPAGEPGLPGSVSVSIQPDGAVREEHGFRLTSRAAAPLARAQARAVPSVAPAGSFTRTRGEMGTAGSVSVGLRFWLGWFSFQLAVQIY